MVVDDPLITRQDLENGFACQSNGSSIVCEQKLLRKSMNTLSIYWSIYLLTTWDRPLTWGMTDHFLAGFINEEALVSESEEEVEENHIEERLVFKEGGMADWGAKVL